MLFYASEKYPDEDSYSKYISEHGGYTNAFTSNENTNYNFDVNAENFEEALDRFAQFFIKPSMSPDATMREIRAVNSENQKNLLSDTWRMDQLQKHLSSKDHPYHRFSTGNLDSLDVWPKERGVDTRLELLSFYEEHYSANIMHLVVYAKENLDKIESLVENIFQEIPNKERSSWHCTGQPCTSEHLQILVKAIPIKQGHELRVVWPATPDIQHYKEGASCYLSHLIGHEGNGSLFCSLKKMGWATYLYAGETEWTNDFSFFSVIIDLTDAGHEHMEDVVGMLFKYIDLLQKCGICEWIFNELSAISETRFHYRDKVHPVDYVINIASNMQFYPPNDWLVGSSLPSKFNPGRIQLLLDELNPNNIRIFWSSMKFEGHAKMIEPWYGTAYCAEKITESMVQQWMERAPNVHLHLPAPNVFIPTDLSLKSVAKKAESPVLLRNSSFSRLWYKPDTLFSTPKAYVIIDLHCPYSRHSPEAEVLTYIFTHLLVDYLNEYAYDAQIAGLGYSIHVTRSGFQVSVGGYNHKLRILLETIIEKVVKFEVKPDRFYVIKETITKEYQNIKFQQPHDQAGSYCSLILHDHSWPWTDELEALSHLEPDNLAKFAPLMLSRAFLQCYIAGNIGPTEAESVIQKIEDIIFNGPHSISKYLLPSQHLTNRVAKLAGSTNFFYPVEGLNPSNENSALIHYIQVHQDDFVLNVKLRLFCLIGKQAAFHQLRTVEQLGYVTSMSRRNDFGIHGVQFCIQSTVKDPIHLYMRVESFLEKFENQLCELSDDEFKSRVNALIDMKLEKYKNLWEESCFYWHEISNGTLKFDRTEREVGALKQLTHQELIDFFNEYIKVGAPTKKTLSVQVYGSLHTSEYKSQKSDPIPPNSVRIEDIFSFRNSQSMYGSFQGGCGRMKLQELFPGNC
ncbi:insulin-degrading enzyme-like 1, peroxisomal isoform X2 [Rhododendron vialii]|nr:insulin-degrading enzyme-like 1, peroxisomal isoform X2 [Rhododendron vialii]XP_058205101.1 insulin-degrading enzyme-like 1, peroxisomal isoform X2 [Rhododendron vialii]